MSFKKKFKELHQKASDPLGIGKNLGVDLADPLGVLYGRDNASGPELDTSAELEAIKQLAEEYGTSVEQMANEFSNLSPEEYEYMGDMEVASQGDSAMADITSDTRFDDAQMKSLELLEQMSDEGLTATDKANLAGIESGANRNLRGQMGAIKQNMQSRGISGSGLDLMSQQNAAQASAERQALRDLEVAAQGQGRRERATMDLGQLGGQLNQQDFQRQAAQARAQDAINRFNTSNTNRANQYNQSTQQRIANQNTGTANQRQVQGYDARRGAAGSAYAARSGNSQLDYDAKVDQYNREALADKQRKEAGAGQLGAIGGVAGGVIGGIYGGPAGAAAGSQAGSGLGRAAYSGDGNEQGGFFAKGGTVGPDGQKVQGGCYAEGGRIPGETNGVDSYADDMVEITVQPGEIVIPETVATSPEASAEFVANENGMTVDNTDDIIGAFIKTVSELNKKRRR